MMMRNFILALLVQVLAAGGAFAQHKDVTEIRGILVSQTANWNKGDLDAFMEGYWHSDSLMFVGKSGITYGYARTLEHYKRDYDSPEKMGQLSFDILRVDRLSADYYFVIGKWFLKRNAGDVGGIYTLLFRKIGGRWWIVADHSS
jgi:ketosteroid isomerase-like protein